MLKRERLSTEKAELARSTTKFQERAAQMQAFCRAKIDTENKCSNISLLFKANPK